MDKRELNCSNSEEIYKRVHNAKLFEGKKRVPAHREHPRKRQHYKFKIHTFKPKILPNQKSGNLNYCKLHMAYMKRVHKKRIMRMKHGNKKRRIILRNNIQYPISVQ